MLQVCNYAIEDIYNRVDLPQFITSYNCQQEPKQVAFHFNCNPRQQRNIQHCVEFIFSKERSYVCSHAIFVQAFNSALAKGTKIKKHGSKSLVKPWDMKLFSKLPLPLNAAASTSASGENKVVLALLAGKRTLDWAACRGRLVLGADHPGIINLINGKTKNVPTNAVAELQKAISRITGYEKIIFTKTGSEAQELAIRLVASWGEREGKDKEKGIALVTPCSPWSHERFPLGPMKKKALPFDNLSALEGELWTNNSAVAFMMNTIHWSEDKGFQVPGTRYLTEVRRVCDKHNILWVTDESASAFGRTGYPLAFMAESCRPDIVVIGDTLGGGIYPTSAVLLSDRVFCGKEDKPVLKLPDSTLSNHAAAVGLEVIKGYEMEDLAEAARMNGICLKTAIQWALGPEELTCVTGKGLLMAIRVHGGIGSASEICLEMRKRGVSVWPCSDHYILITPPLTTSQEELVAGVIVLAGVLDWLLERTARKHCIGKFKFD